MDALTEDDTARVVSGRLLARIEGWARVAALVALSDWDRVVSVNEGLLGPLAALARPSFGTWLGVLRALRGAHRGAAARLSTTESYESGAPLEGLRHILRTMDERLSPLQVEELNPLVCRLSGAHRRPSRIEEALELAVRARNTLVHDQPPPGWLVSTRPAVESLARIITDRELLPAAITDQRRSPWLRVLDGQLLAFNGLADGSARFVREGAEVVLDDAAGAAILFAIRRMTGREHLQQKKFLSLIERLSLGEQPGILIGDYLVIGQPIGEGGSAKVYPALQLSTGQRVALKVLNDPVGSEEVQADAPLRFQQEVDFLSRLRHRRIVKLFDFGREPWRVPSGLDEPWVRAWKSGPAVRMFMALEWIEGRTLDQLFQSAFVREEESAPLELQLAEWLREVADALSFIHAAGLIHRDLTPKNLMCAEDGSIRVMDFGIARGLGPSAAGMTRPGFAPGTPGYMSPEQNLAAVDPMVDIGPRSDLYTIGVTFYELATGKRFVSVSETVDLLESASRKPRRSPVSARQAGAKISREFDQILQCLIEVEPSDRYPSASILERDVGRLMRHEPLEHRPPSRFRRLQLAYFRNRRMFHIVGSFMLLISCGVTTSWILLEKERGLTRSNFSRLLSERGRQSERELDFGHAATWFSQALEVRDEQETREELLLAHATTPRLRWSGPADLEPWAIDSSKDGTTLIVGTRWGRLLRLDARDGRVEWQTEAHQDAIERVLLLDDGTVVSGGADRLVKLWDERGRKLRELVGHSDVVTSLAVCPDQTVLASGSWDQTIKLWDRRSGLMRASAKAHDGWVRSVEFSSDGALLASSGDDNLVKLFDGASLAPISTFSGHDGRVRCLAFDPSGTRIVSGSADRTVRLWSVKSGELVGTIQDFADEVMSVDFDPAGSQILTGCYDGTAAIHAVRGLRLFLRTQPLVGRVLRAAFVGDGKRMVTATESGTVIGWSLDTDTPARAIVGAHQGWVRRLVLAPDGRTIASSGLDGDVALWSMASLGQSHRLPHAHRGMVTAIAFDPGGASLVTAGYDGEVKTWSLGELSRAPRKIAQHEGRIYDLVLLGGGRVLTAGLDHNIKLWSLNATTDEPLQVFQGHGLDVWSLSLSTDGFSFFSGAADGTVRVWRLDQATASKTLRPKVGDSREFLTAVCLSRNEVASGGEDGVLRVWDVEGNSDCRELKGHTNAIFCLAFDPRSQRLYSGSRDGTVRAWQMPLGTPLFTLRGHRTGARCILVTPGSRSVVTGDGEGTIRFWDLDRARDFLSLSPESLRVRTEQVTGLTRRNLDLAPASTR